MIGSPTVEINAIYSVRSVNKLKFNSFSSHERSFMMLSFRERLLDASKYCLVGDEGVVLLSECAGSFTTSAMIELKTLFSMLVRVDMRTWERDEKDS